jgi:thymidylate synthase
LAEIYESLSAAYRSGLAAVLEAGQAVPSVRGAKSKASNFGQADRPWIDIIGHQVCVQNRAPEVVTPGRLKTHVPYLLGLLAWTLDGRDDLSTLEYYRVSARDFSDDGATMCGAFGHRMFGGDNQFKAVLERLRSDPASRRAFVPIIAASDNLLETLEYPCAAGVQLFVRDRTLHWLTVMRAQQALTVAPYDLSLFGILHHFVAAELGLDVGLYRHFAGTFHIYANEVDIATQIAGEIEPSSLFLPGIVAGQGPAVRAELIACERDIRVAAENQDRDRLNALDRTKWTHDFVRTVSDHLVAFARQRSGIRRQGRARNYSGD